ncbi:MAG: class I SAM-dependent methyltransferase [Alphaproteobacteria bacterium]|nr:class I SAM-dependent methyltransferase [Alphaproteobacteria bacterium]
MKTNYLEVTELAGESITSEQLDRLCNRYYWAMDYCRDKDVLEVACGTGPGLGYLASAAKSLVAGDVSNEIVEIARNHYGKSIDIRQFDACSMPFSDASFDVIIIFEAIYYLPSIDKFIEECKRILRSNGHILIATANKDLYDFVPSPHSVQYYGVCELSNLFKKHGFETKFYGGTALKDVSLKQKIVRPIKKIASKLGLIPKTMKGKKWLKKVVFGDLLPMPAEINASTVSYDPPVPLSDMAPNSAYKVIFSSAQLKED